jgi:integrase
VAAIQNIDNQKYLSKEELKRLFAWLKTSHGKQSLHREHSLRNYLCFRLAYLHGMRISEVLSLQWQDIDFGTGLITIRRLKDSITNSQVMRSDEMRELKRLKNLYWNERLTICKPDGTGLTRQTMNNLLAKASEVIGKKVTPHSMKHTCGVHLALAGKNIREIQHHLGHKDVKNTLIYMNYSPTGNANDLI